MDFIIGHLKQKSSWAGIGIGAILLGGLGISGEMADLVSTLAIAGIALYEFVRKEQK